MKSKAFQILIFGKEKRDDRQAFESLEEILKDLFIPIPAKKKILNIWMELYQNLVKFRNSERLALFKLEINNTGFIQMRTLNFGPKVHVNTLEQKFLSLESSFNLRTEFQKKLENKVENQDKKTGDFGLDFCFRYSQHRSFKRIKHIDNEDIVYLSFSFPSYE